MISKKFATTSLCFAICAGSFTLSPGLAQESYVYQEKQRIQTQEVSAPVDAPAQEAMEAEEDAEEASESDNAVVAEPAPTTESQTTVVQSATPVGTETTTTTTETSAPVPGVSSVTTETSTTETTVAAPAIVAPVMTPVIEAPMVSVPTIVSPVVVAPVVATPAPVTPKVVAIQLPADRKYLLIDPMTGEITNGFDPTLAETELTPLAGMVVVERSTGRLVAGINSGRVVSVTTMSPNQTMLGAIEHRRVELDKIISDALSRGTLDIAAATAMRAKLDAISAQRARFLSSDNSISFAEALTLIYGLNSISDHVISVARVPSFAALPGTRFVSTEGNIVFMGDLDYRIFRLSKRVDSEFALGRLSSRQVADLKQRLNEVRAEQDRSLEKGSLDGKKIQDLVEKLDDIGSKLARAIASKG